jgi:hypothetical protein
MQAWCPARCWDVNKQLPALKGLTVKWDNRRGVKKSKGVD